MKSIEELALKVAAEMDDVYLRNVPAVTLCDFATRFLAAYTQQQDPVAQVLTSSTSGGTYSHPPFIEQLPAGTKLYAAPIVPADRIADLERQVAELKVQRDELLMAMIQAHQYAAGNAFDQRAANILYDAIAKVQP